MFYDATNIDQKVVQWVEPTTISSLLHRLMGALASTGYFLRWLRHRLCAQACAACCRASHVRTCCTLPRTSDAPRDPFWV